MPVVTIWLELKSTPLAFYHAHHPHTLQLIQLQPITHTTHTLIPFIPSRSTISLQIENSSPISIDTSLY